VNPKLNNVILVNPKLNNVNHLPKFEYKVLNLTTCFFKTEKKKLLVSLPEVEE